MREDDGEHGVDGHGVNGQGVNEHGVDGHRVHAARVSKHEVGADEGQADVGLATPQSLRDRARGALIGLAIGEALGMPTQLFAREQVRARFGELTGFVDGPPDQPVSPGVSAGTVTDGTAQALLLAAELIEGQGQVDRDRFAGRLVKWAADVDAAGSPTRPGRSTVRALGHIRRTGSTVGAGTAGDTNGAAARIVGVGIARRSDPFAALVDLVVDADAATHDTSIAHAGAAAVACAVSAAIDGVPGPQILPLALSAAALGGQHGHRTPGPDVGARMAWACGLARGSDDPLTVVDLLVGTSMATQESVPAAFAIAQTFDDPWAACLAAASLGGDADTVAAMVGAMAGARAGLAAFPPDAVALVEAANPGLDLIATADALLALRDAGPDARP